MAKVIDIHLVERQKILAGEDSDETNVIINLLDDNHRQVGKLYLFDQEIKKALPDGINHLSDYDAYFFSSQQIVIEKARAAICRLEYPLELSDEYKFDYLAYLKRHESLITPVMIMKDDLRSLSIMAGAGVINPERLDIYLEEASSQGKVELVALLLDYKNKAWGQDIHPVFDLSDRDSVDEWVIEENYDGTLSITQYLGAQPTVTIPAAIGGKRVKTIEGWSLGSLKVSLFFKQKSLLESVIIEDGIEVIGERAFLECVNLKSVTLPTSIKKINQRAFSFCKSLSTIDIPEGVELIGYNAFENCPASSEVKIPKSMKEIGKNAFSGLQQS